MLVIMTYYLRINEKAAYEESDDGKAILKDKEGRIR